MSISKYVGIQEKSILNVAYHIHGKKACLIRMLKEIWHATYQVKLNIAVKFFLMT